MEEINVNEVNDEVIEEASEDVETYEEPVEVETLERIEVNPGLVVLAVSGIGLAGYGLGKAAEKFAIKLHIPEKINGLKGKIIYKQEKRKEAKAEKARRLLEEISKQNDSESETKPADSAAQTNPTKKTTGKKSNQ